jgi:2-iminobutanoate/2-iminopropanoate deaminase
MALRTMLRTTILASLVAASVAPAFAAEYFGGDYERSRAYSPAIITRGGKTVWLAGVATNKDAQGHDISGNFEAQVKTVFARLDDQMKKAGGSLQDVVAMTVYIKEVRYGDRFVAMRKDFFPSGHFPTSSLITINNLAQPGIEIEISGVAVVGDECSAEKPCH